MHCGFYLSARVSSRPMIGQDVFMTCPKTQRIAAHRICTTPCLPMKNIRVKGFGAVARKSLLDMQGESPNAYEAKRLVRHASCNLTKR